jgi:DNA-binding NarL/FixJ family response regulator
MLIDADPVFRLGLRFGLSAFPDIQIMSEAPDGETALQLLASRFNAMTSGTSSGVIAETIDPPNPNLTAGIDLIALDIELGRTNPEQIQGLTLCQQLKTQYPNLPVLLFSPNADPLFLAAAEQAGANGFCLKSAELPDLIGTIRQAAFGQPLIQAPRPSLSVAPPSTPSALVLLRNWRRSGNQQIDRALTEVTNALQDLSLSPLDRTILSGRYRELRAARWLLNRLLDTPILPEPAPAAPNAQPLIRSTDTSSSLPHSSSLISPAVNPSPPADLQNLQSIVFDAVFANLQTSLENQTGVPLEIDILREDKKRELIYLILRKYEDLIAELRYSQAALDLLEQKRSMLLLDLWQATVADFFGRYATVEVHGTAIEIVNVLLQDGSIVEPAILDKIPGFIELLAHLLFQSPIVVDSTPYSPGNPAALERAELLLENLLIQVANAVVQPLLNRFANVEAIKQTFYDRRLLSSREVERFRNDLSWKYRVERYFNEPKDIFESQYRLFTFTGRGIQRTTIYTPRNQELAELSGIPLVVTVALETRDAIAPRVRSTVAFVGNGVIYVLTNVIGRGIGLIGRGILEGIGNVFQDDRFSRK